MINNSQVTLENGVSYVVVDKIEHNGSFYIYLANKNNEEDIAIRKEIIENGEEHYLVGLNNDEEFNTALGLFLEKNNISE